MITPYPDQIDFTNKIISKLRDGYTRVCCQASTGFGKTVVFAYLLTRYLIRNISAKIIILVHRDELLIQAQEMLRDFKLHGISVEMVETFNNKITKHGVDKFRYDMLIVDECHRGEFFKVIDHYKPNPETLVLGFTATPISSDKRKPLKNYFQTIVCALPINDLIKMGRLTPPIHHDIAQEIGKISKGGNDYNMTQMGIEFSKPRLVEAVVHAYKEYAEGKKMLVYNSTIEHSDLVNKAFLDAGYPSRTLDSEALKRDKSLRKSTLKWLRETPGAILNNCGILTTGFDDTTIEGQIFNRKTKSLPLWIQCGGRPARVLKPEEIASGLTKPYFLILDMGGNIDGEGFGHWNERHDWEQYFLHPDKIKEGGVAPMKNCPACHVRIYMSSTRCMWCGHEMPREVVYTDMIVKLRICPETGIKRNSHDALMKAIEHAADRVKNVPVIGINERKELMFYAFKDIYERSSFEPRTHIISHLVSVYGK